MTRDGDLDLAFRSRLALRTVLALAAGRARLHIDLLGKLEWLRVPGGEWAAEESAASICVPSSLLGFGATFFHSISSTVGLSHVKYTFAHVNHSQRHSIATAPPCRGTGLSPLRMARLLWSAV